MVNRKRHFSSHLPPAGVTRPAASFCAIDGCNRWRQGRSPFCRTCENAQRMQANLVAVAEAAVDREMAELARQVDALEPKKPNRIIHVDGREFEVVWDGQTPLVFS